MQVMILLGIKSYLKAVKNWERKLIEQPEAGDCIRPGRTEIAELDLLPQNIVVL